MKNDIKPFFRIADDIGDKPWLTLEADGSLICDPDLKPDAAAKLFLSSLKEQWKLNESIPGHGTRISNERYEALLEAEATLNALRAAGVDNWPGYEDAMQELHKDE